MIFTIKYSYHSTPLLIKPKTKWPDSRKKYNNFGLFFIITKKGNIQKLNSTILILQIWILTHKNLSNHNSTHSIKSSVYALHMTCIKLKHTKIKNDYKLKLFYKINNK